MNQHDRIWRRRAVVFILPAALGLTVILCTTIGPAGIAFTDVLTMLLRTALIIAAFGLFASLVGWILQQAPGDAPTFLARATSLLFWALVALVALWLLATLVFAADGNRGIVVLAFARAMGEFGATITFAGNIEGRTRTLPLAVYLLLDSDPDVAIALSLVLLVLSLVVLVSLRDRWTGALSDRR